MADAVIPYDYAVEVRPFVQTDAAVFRHTVGSGAVGQFGGETQRSVVKYLAVLVTVGEYQLPVLHQGWRAAAECGSHAVGIHAFAVVQVERGVQEALLAHLFHACLLEGVALVPAPHVQTVAVLSH